MKALVLGGTGLISAGVVKHLLARGAEVTLFNRGRSNRVAPPGVCRIAGDRSNVGAFVRTFENSRFDVVIDMICFTPEEAEATVAAFGGRCEQLVFCSTVCTYGPRVPASVLVDETMTQEPVTPYGRAKLTCERVFLRAMQRGSFRVTILRPSHTYGLGSPLLDQLELDGKAWGRIAHGQPVLCAGDGLGLWQPTHRDDCGKLFAHAALNPKCYGEAYNATGDEIVTWRDYYALGAAALGVRAKLTFAPSEWLLERAPDRFRFLAEVSRFHGAYSSAKAKAQVPEFRSEIGFSVGASEVLSEMRQHPDWHRDVADLEYRRIVDRALESGFGVVDA